MSPCAPDSKRPLSDVMKRRLVPDKRFLVKEKPLTQTKETAAMRNLYLGIDVGKKFCWICVLNEEYECVYFERVATLQEAAWREMLGLFEGHEVHAAFETGAHYEWMFDLLSACCAKVEVVNTARFALISQSQKKTDKVDAEKLAQGLWRGDLPLVYVPEKWVRKDRRLVAHIHALTQSLTSVSAIGTITRFATPDELSSYFGLCGKVEQSGDRLRLGQITKRGNKHVRWLLGQAITHLIRRDPKARRKYLKWRRKKKAKVARVALMRWVTTVLWRMLTHKEKYRLSGVPGCHFKRKNAA